MKTQEELWVVSCLQHAPFEINVELIDVFVLFENILQKKFKGFNLFNRKEIEQATRNLNNEIDEAAEEFYNTKKAKKKTMAYHYKSSF